MAVAQTLAVALAGLSGNLISVEAAVSSQLPGMAIIGLPDTALSEAKQRIRVACQNSGLTLSNRFLTLNLSPAELPKYGSGFDLSMALAALAVAGEVPLERLASTVHIGELGLDGAVRGMAGVLPAVRAAALAGIHTVMVPSECYAEANLVTGVTIIPVRTLSEAVEWHARGITEPGSRSSTPSQHLRSYSSGVSASCREQLDMSDVIGQRESVEAAVIAAVGNHHLSLVGTPGTGKSMLAQRIPTILPDLSDEAALEATSIASLDRAHPVVGLVRRPPFEAPHHTATAASLLGSHTRTVVPGSFTRASHGVLFLDEAAEFGPGIIDNLRQPLEMGTLTLQRARWSVVLPANFLLVLASNPCPCGQYGAPNSTCTCSGGVVRKYAARISGPINDRIDLRVNLFSKTRVAAPPSKRPYNSPPCSRYGDSSAALRDRVTRARARAAVRLRPTPWRVNGQVSGTWLRNPDNRLSSQSTAAIDAALEEGRLSMRAYDRILKVAWSIADIEDEDYPSPTHVARAFRFRSGEFS